MAEPNIQFGVASGDNPWGTLSGWNPQQPSKDVTFDRATAADANGDEAVSKLSNGRTEYSTPFQASVTGSAPTVPANIGAVLNSGAAVLLSIDIGTTRNAFATMTLAGHQHADNPHADTLRQVAHGITLADGYGAKDFLGGTAGSNAAVQSGSISIKVEHVDETDESGDHLVGNNYGGMLEATTVWTGVPSATSDGSWDITSTVTAPNNQGIIQTTVKGTKKLTLA